MNTFLSKMVRGTAVAALAMVALAFSSSSAEAQHHGRGGHGGGYSRAIPSYGGIGCAPVYRGYGGYGYGGSGLSINIGSGRGVSLGYSSFRPSYVAPRVYHNTTHFDYHRGGYVPHRGHFDYVPGHYDLHRSGHWHR